MLAGSFSARSQLQVVAQLLEAMRAVARRHAGESWVSHVHFQVLEHVLCEVRKFLDKSTSKYIPGGGGGNYRKLAEAYARKRGLALPAGKRG